MIIRKAKQDYHAQYMIDCAEEIEHEKLGTSCNMSYWFRHRRIGLVKDDQRPTPYIESRCLEDCPKMCKIKFSYSGISCPSEGCSAQTPCGSCQSKIKKDIWFKRLVKSVSNEKPFLRWEEYCDYRNAGFMWWK